MTDPRRIAIDAIRAKVTEQSYDRGVDYYHASAVESATTRGDQLFVTVQGSEWDPYSIVVSFTGDDFTASCTCPYDWGGYCKHVVSALLTVDDDDPPIPIESKAPVAQLVDGLEAPALRVLVQRLVDDCPALADAVDEFCGVESI